MLMYVAREKQKKKAFVDVRAFYFTVSNVRTDWGVEPALANALMCKKNVCRTLL